MEGNSSKLISEISKWTIGLITAVSLACILVWSFGCRVTIDGHSMINILNDGDEILVNRAVYKFNSVSRFDIIYFNYGDSSSSVKRVIGLPGETVLIKNGDVYINGNKLDMTFTTSSYNVSGIAEDELKLGADEYFLLGDNGDSSEDSRFSAVGIVLEEQIEGKVWFRLSPFSDIGKIESGATQ